MNKAFYEELQMAFIVVRSLCFDACYDKKRFDYTLNFLQTARNDIAQTELNNNHKILLYCLDTLFDIINEGNKEKIFDFCDTIHNIPEIFLGKRKPNSFDLEITAFRQKYGTEYFSIF